MSDSGKLEMSRRVVLAGSAAAVAVTTMSSAEAQATAQRDGTMPQIVLDVNGGRQTLQVDTRTTLLDALREQLQLTGTKKGCDHGQSGACTVIVDGRRINSCLTLAVMHQHDKITTIEGRGTPEDLHPMQAAFIKHDGYQCEYCTPGQICSAVAVLAEIKASIPSHVSADLTKHPEATNAEMRERMSGNICRCDACSNILEAMTEVAEPACAGPANRPDPVACNDAAGAGRITVAADRSVYLSIQFWKRPVSFGYEQFPGSFPILSRLHARRGRNGRRPLERDMRASLMSGFKCMVLRSPD